MNQILKKKKRKKRKRKELTAVCQKYLEKRKKQWIFESGKVLPRVLQALATTNSNQVSK